jgi:GNAT superfamily N-acetyltransferase
MEYELGTCRPDEMFDLVELVNRIFRAGGSGNMGEEYPLVFEAQNCEGLRVARAGGRVVAHVGVCIRDASILGAAARVASIGAVGTDPDHRGQGLASRLMADARRHALEQGVSLMLISGGRGLYHRLGYVNVGGFQRYAVPAAPTGKGPETGFEAAEYRPDDLPAIIRLHETEPVRFHRSYDDWNRIIAAGMLMNQRMNLQVIRHGNAIVAYAGMQLPRDGSPARVLRAQEIGGSRSALAAALPGIAARFGAEAAEVIAWDADAEWRTQALLRGWAWSSVAFPGTLGIIDPHRFLAAIAPLVRERSRRGLSIEPEGEGARLAAEGEGAGLATMGELTALVFGGETDEARAVPNLPPSVRAAVDEVFPLPLLWYGYNYV